LILLNPKYIFRKVFIKIFIYIKDYFIHKKISKINDTVFDGTYFKDIFFRKLNFKKASFKISSFKNNLRNFSDLFIKNSKFISETVSEEYKIDLLKRAYES